MSITREVMAESPEHLRWIRTGGKIGRLLTSSCLLGQHPRCAAVEQV